MSRLSRVRETSFGLCDVGRKNEAIRSRNFCRYIILYIHKTSHYLTSPDYYMLRRPATTANLLLVHRSIAHCNPYTRSSLTLHGTSRNRPLCIRNNPHKLRPKLSRMSRVRHDDQSSFTRNLQRMRYPHRHLRYAVTYFQEFAEYHHHFPARQATSLILRLVPNQPCHVLV